MTQVHEHAPVVRPALVRRLPEPGVPRPADPPVPVPATPPPAPDPASTGMNRRVELVLRLVLEVLAGRRPVTQLKGLVTPPVLRYVAAEATRPARVRPEPARRPAGAWARGHRLRAVRVFRPCAAAAEVSAVWPRDGRFRALAARFELLPTADGEPRWCCTALRLG